jgi:hypothetical protein
MLLQKKEETMKILLTVMTLLIAMSAQASHFKEYKDADMELTNKLLNLCPNEIVEMMSTGGSSKITAAGFVGGMAPDMSVRTSWKVEVTTQYPAPSFHTETSVLIIKEVLKRSNNPAPDAPGMTTEVTCTIP